MTEAKSFDVELTIRARTRVDFSEGERVTERPITEADAVDNAVGLLPFGFVDSLIGEGFWCEITGTARDVAEKPCAMVPDGTDTNGDEWNRCTVHGSLVLGDAPYCEGYRAPEYVEPFKPDEEVVVIHDETDDAPGMPWVVAIQDIDRQNAPDIARRFATEAEAEAYVAATPGDEIDAATRAALEESAALDARAEAMAREGDA